MAIDDAIVHTDRTDTARCQAAAAREGAAAAAAERAKRSRYPSLPIAPFVLEAGGRQGEAAQGVVVLGAPGRIDSWQRSG
eukprot:7405335-Alexandrium_andersonii.AAC.1